MRLHQRIGRLDRYGQADEVIAYNLQRTGTIEDRLRGYLDEKIAAIMEALRELEGDRVEDLREAVLGQLDQQIDLPRVYAEALLRGTDRSSRAELDAAMSRVSEAARRMAQMYGMLDRFDLRAFRDLLPRYQPVDVETFVQRYLEHRGRRLKDYKNGSFGFLMPDELRRRRLDPKQLDKVVFDRARLKEHREARLLGFGDLYYDRIIADCLRPDFDGEVALRRVSRGERKEGSRGYQFCFIVTKRDRVGETPVEYDLWVVFLDETLREDRDTAERLLREWSVHARGPVAAVDPPDQVDGALRAAQALADARLRALARDCPGPLFELRLHSCAIVQFV
jgi:hypothetical protein